MPHPPLDLAVEAATPKSGRRDWSGSINVQTWSLIDAGRLRPDRLSLLGKPLDLRPQLLETFLPHQFLKVTAGAEIRVQLSSD